MTEAIDVAVVGGGIVGVATAHTLLERNPSLRATVIEKEAAVGQHQTGHNSGVIHSGVYYRPSSAKARLCLEGRRLLIEYCESRGIPTPLTGKLIVATHPKELPALLSIRERASENGISNVTPLTSKEIQEREPEVRGLAALEVASTRIVDYREVVRAMARDLSERGAGLLLSAPVQSVEREGEFTVVRTTRGDVRTRYLINCAGLHADRIARLAGLDPQIQIVPFRGEFYTVHPDRGLQLSHLIYPVPDPTLPFLGVHLTLTVRGEITAGPNAVLGGAREGYGRSTLSWHDAAEMAFYPGFWRMARRFWRTGVYEEFRSLSRDQYLHDVRRLVPRLEPHDLVAGQTGVRAQAVGRDGRLVDDFVFGAGRQSLHVLNAPSPAATSSFAIANEIIQQVPALR
jgi:(S)-2-hydroxyglutarate dehydrogenase